jgi:hypothetical protein
MLYGVQGVRDQLGRAPEWLQRDDVARTINDRMKNNGSLDMFELGGLRIDGLDFVLGAGEVDERDVAPGTEPGDGPSRFVNAFRLAAASSRASVDSARKIHCNAYPFATVQKIVRYVSFPLEGFTLRR